MRPGGSEGDHLVHLALKSLVQVREAPHLHPLHHVGRRPAVPGGGAPLPLWGAPTRFPLGQTPLQAQRSHIIRRIPFSLATLASLSPRGLPFCRIMVLSSKKKIPTTSTPWTPASSWGRIICPSLWLAARGLASM